MESEWNSCQYIESNGFPHTGDSGKRPVTILSALESATSTWINVNMKTYTLGETIFLNNANTGCATNSCYENKYVLEERSGRARLITVPEAWAVGCASSSQ